MHVEYKGKKFKIKNVKGSGLHLDLRKKKIEDISQISGLDEFSDLVSLNLDENQITEITGLSNLRNLHFLSLSDNKIAEIKGLENLINLKNLDLGRNQISEIKGLENQTNLEQLNLTYNEISELKGLENLTNLNLVRLFHNPVFDWIEEELGTFGLAKTVVKYCARRTGKERLNLEEVENFITLKKEEISNTVQAKEYYKVMKILRGVHDEVKLDDSTLFFKFFGEFLWDFPKLFEQKKFVSEYMSEISYIFTEKQGFQMETYIINHYCTYQNEEVLTSFSGKIKSHQMIYEGRIHITGFRIFVFGKKEEQSNIPYFIPVGVGFIANIIKSAVLMGIKAEGKALLNKYGRVGDIPSFGYQFPLLNIVRNEVVDDKCLKISCNLGNSSFNMKIYPKQLENEDRKELSERIKFISSIIQEGGNSNI